MRKRRLVLHFDVNNTVVMNDRAMRRNTLDTVARIVSQGAWGRKFQLNEEWKWELCHDQLSQERPEHFNLLANLPEIDQEFQVCNYEEFLRVKCAGEESSIEERQAALRMNFVKPGNPGSKFKSTFEKMLKQLTLPKAVRDNMGISGGESLASLGSETVQPPMDSQNVTLEPSKEGNDEDKLRMRKLFQDGYYSLIPSFFKTLIALKK